MEINFVSPAAGVAFHCLKLVRVGVKVKVRNATTTCIGQPSAVFTLKANRRLPTLGVANRDWKFLELIKLVKYTLSASTSSSVYFVSLYYTLISSLSQTLFSLHFRVHLRTLHNHYFNLYYSYKFHRYDYFLTNTNPEHASRVCLISVQFVASLEDSSLLILA